MTKVQPYMWSTPGTSTSAFKTEERWPLGFAVNSILIFRNVTLSNAKWLKISLGEDLGLDLGIK